jgi:hypothetical protein
MDWDPTLVAQWSHNVVRWKCALGHQFLARVADRSKGDGCPFCAGKKVLMGFNDLATKNPSLAKQALGWDPRQFTEFSNKKLLWICDLGHEWKSTINHRSNGRGCPSCTKSGFDPNQNGWVYFLHHPEKSLLQIGITNRPKDRISLHQSRGWEINDLRGPLDGLLAQEWETAILRHIKKQGGKFADKIGIEPFDGYSESWLKESFSFASLREIMSKIDLEKEEQ